VNNISLPNKPSKSIAVLTSFMTTLEVATLLVVVLTPVLVMIVTVIALILVLWKQVLRNQKYTRLISILLIFSLLDSIANQLHWFLTDYAHYGWVLWIVGVTVNLTGIMLMICQVELLSSFSPIAPFWDSKKIYRLKGFFVITNLLAVFPSYIYPINHYIVHAIDPEWFMNLSEVFFSN
jgi:glucose-6-phosphate-specific signal transduction histidine kinase